MGGRGVERKPQLGDNLDYSLLADDEHFAFGDMGLTQQSQHTQSAVFSFG
jgi:hypothetical protein